MTPSGRKRIHVPRTSFQVFVFFMILNCCAGFFQGTGNTDEIWNFTFGWQASMGHLPYRDFNMLQTPLSAWINGLSMALLGRQVLVFRFNGAILFSLIALAMRRISLRFGADAYASLLPGMIFSALMCTNVFLEYSCLILFFQLVIMNCDMQAMDAGTGMKKRTLVLTGVLAGLCILSKQTTGVFLCLASLITAFLTNRKDHPWKAMECRLSGMCIPCLLFLAYLLFTGTFHDFMDYCFYGISTFTAKGSYDWYLSTGTGNMLHGILMPVPVLAACILCIQKRKEKEGKTLLIFLILLAGGLINMYPITNYYHMTVALGPALCLVPRMLTLMDEKLFHKDIFGSLVKIVPAGYLLFALCGYAIIGKSEGMTMLDVPHFKGVMSEPFRKEEMELLSPYIEQVLSEGSEIYILDNTAEYCLIPYDIYHKDLDMFLYGNLGTRTPQECLEESLEESAYYLIADSTRSNTQFPSSEIRAFEKKLKKTGETEGFAFCNNDVNN